MELSEEEKQVLLLLEQSLYSDDPGFAKRMRPEARRNLTRVAWGSLAGVAGMAVVVAGVALDNVLLGVAGFAGALGAGAWARRSRHTHQE